MLDGSDLGLGILFPWARNREHRGRMMRSIAPMWDGDETWLVLGGAASFAAFPDAYAILLSASYLPPSAMLIALVLRGVATAAMTLAVFAERWLFFIEAKQAVMLYRGSGDERPRQSTRTPKPIGRNAFAGGSLRSQITARSPSPNTEAARAISAD